MKEALENNDIKVFAKLISYPCRWNKTKNTIMIKNEQDFLKHQTAILTPEVKKLILNARLDDLFVNSQGFMLDNGVIWFAPAKVFSHLIRWHDHKLVAIFLAKL